jgi:hypothetical protein
LLHGEEPDSSLVGIMVLRGTGTASERASVWRAAVASGLVAWDISQSMATSACRLLVGKPSPQLFICLPANFVFARGTSPAAPDCWPP